MGRAKIRLDRSGIAELLRSDDMARGVDEATEAIAGNVRELGIRVEHIPGDIELPVETVEYDRASHEALVVLAHPSGNAVQAKDGALTKAAGAAGLEVRGSV